MDRRSKYGRIARWLVTSLNGAFLASMWACAPTQSAAQNILIGTPTTEASSGFQAGGGFSLNGSLGGIPFGLSGGQSSARGITSQSPWLTISNGGSGAIIDVVQRPFVIGYVPVVGGFHATYPAMYTSPAQMPSLTYPLHQKIQQLASQTDSSLLTRDSQRRVDTGERQDRDQPSHVVSSTATQPDIGVKAIRRRQAALAAANQAAIAEFVAKAEQAEQNGNFSKAIRWINEARRSSLGRRRRQFELQLREMRTRAKDAKAKK